MPVYDGFALQFGNRLAGPRIIEQVNTTTFVTPEFNVRHGRFGTYTLYLQETRKDRRVQDGRVSHEHVNKIDNGPGLHPAEAPQVASPKR